MGGVSGEGAVLVANMVVLMFKHHIYAAGDQEWGKRCQVIGLGGQGGAGGGSME